MPGTLGPVIDSVDVVQVPRRGLRMPDPRADPMADPETGGEFERLAAVARLAEESGFDSLWVSDDAGRAGHSQGRSAAVFEAYSLLGALAVRTTQVGLGVFPLGPTVRSPSMVAKIITGVDVISHGRGILALGVGGNHDHESIDRLSEELQICRRMLTEEAPSFDGRFYRLSQAVNRPRPVRAGGIPLVVVADSPAAADPVARWADAVVVGGEPPNVEAMVRGLDERCRVVGRARDAVGVIWSGEIDGGPHRPADQVRAISEMGITGCVVSIADGYDPDTIRATGEALSDVTFE
jgi:alkanesulfonate monooxygenase SsuD/methylene tetrahydromethanopterin reductase-like flavin-dependent oxidoreductase (luciferase family)